MKRSGFLPVMVVAVSLAAGAAYADSEKGAAKPAAVALYEQGKTKYGEGQRDDARALMESACDGGYAEGCYLLGKAYTNRWFGSVGEEAPQEAFLRGCDQGHALACKEAGYAYAIQGVVDPSFRPKAFELRKRACELNELVACQFVGVEYLKSTESWHKQDYAQAAIYLGKACDDDKSTACAELGRMHYYGWGMPANRDEAVRLVQKAYTLSRDNTLVTDIIAELNRAEEKKQAQSQ
ncbi:MAG: tetratricopeptide repeat protein [Hyphomonadaceae bacterium]